MRTTLQTPPPQQHLAPYRSRQPPGCRQYSAGPKALILPGLPDLAGHLRRIRPRRPPHRRTAPGPGGSSLLKLRTTHRPHSRLKPRRYSLGHRRRRIGQPPVDRPHPPAPRARRLRRRRLDPAARTHRMGPLHPTPMRQPGRRLLLQAVGRTHVKGRRPPAAGSTARSTISFRQVGQECWRPGSNVTTSSPLGGKWPTAGRSMGAQISDFRFPTSDFRLVFHFSLSEDLHPTPCVHT